MTSRGEELPGVGGSDREPVRREDAVPFATQNVNVLWKAATVTVALAGFGVAAVIAASATG